MTFGERLAKARVDKNLTQTELGEGLGTDGADASKSVVYGWEKDQHHPRADQLVLICKKLGCSADYLLFGAVSSQYLAAEAVAEKLSDDEKAALLAKLQSEQPAVAAGYQRLKKDSGPNHTPKRKSKKQA